MADEKAKISAQITGWKLEKKDAATGRVIEIIEMLPGGKTTRTDEHGVTEALEEGTEHGAN